MNKARRKALDKIYSELEGLKQQVEELQSEEQDYYDNMPENMQSGEKGEAAQGAADSLESAVSNLDSALADIEEAKQ